MIRRPIIRDRAWLDHLHSERCIFTGQRGTENETIDPMHLGAFKGLKSSDDEVIPVLHRFHAMAHQKGEISLLRTMSDDNLIREVFRAYARQLYAQWRSGK